jgi:uncharacterized protein YhdP
MNDTASPPSRLLKITAVTARWLLGLLIAAWLLLALSVVVLHAWIVPRIGDFRGALEAQASKAIGVPVRIGSITARSEGLFPAFELRDVVLQDADKREALRLVRVVASVSPRSLWRLNLEQLYIEGPQLDVRRDAQGKLHVAGLHMSTDTTGETRGADWFFAQRELVIEGGTVRWTDEQRKAEPLLLTDVRFVARNGGRRHGLRLDATPPAGWGERFSLRGQFRQPLLSIRTGHWQTWDGQLYADLPYIDVTRLGNYVSLGARIREGNGALRMWADVDDGQIVGATADLGLDRVNVALDKELQPLVLRAVTGRLAGQLSEETLEFSTTALQFDTSDGLRWPGGNLWLQHTPAKGRTPEHGAARADRLDLAALALIADRLPLGEATHKVLDAYGPRGLVEHIDLNWQGSLGAPDKYQAKGRVSGLRVASQPGAAGTAAAPASAPAATTPTVATAAAAAATPAPPRVHPGTPGLSGATLEFDATQAGGTATLAIAQGTLEFPGVFEEPVIPIDRLSTQLQWKLENGNAQLQVSKLRFANTDAEGDAEASWRTSDPATSSSKSRYPGVLDLQGKLTRADGTRVFRYLPLDIPQHTRDYVREAVTKGTASSVDFRVRGDLHDMPFKDPKSGDFRIAAKVADVNYAYAPPPATTALSRNGVPPRVWPPLTGLSGELVFERDSMLVRNARGRLAGATGVEVTKAEAQIPELSHHAQVLRVDAQAKGPLGEVLRVGAPLAGETGEIMLRARATGSADYKLHLELPLAAMDNAKVQASVTLADNELQVVPEAPNFTQTKGTLNFTETGFSLAGVQARLLGGDIRIEGKGRFTGPNREVALKAQGTATADGLRNAREIEWLSRLASKASGSTPFAATFSVRDGAPEFSLTSSLQGMALQLPPPLVKTAEEQMPLRIEKKVTARETRQGTGVATQDQLTLDLGRVGAIQYVRDISGTEARVLRGSIGFGLTGGETASLPDKGVFANVNIVKLDTAAWQALLGTAVSNASESAGGAERADDPALAYLPTRIAVRAQQLGVAGRTLHNVVLGGTRDGALWRANIDATELSGYAEYRHTQAGRMTFKLDIADAGELLGRFGMPGVLRRGKGPARRRRQLARLAVLARLPEPGRAAAGRRRAGQFLKADPGLAKLLGVLSLQSLPRRLTLDFRDVFSQGFAFDFIRGDVTDRQGHRRTNNLQMKGVNAAVLMDGSADIARETQDLRVVVVPEINAGTASLVATAINPAIGLGTFLAQMFLREPLIGGHTQEFHVDGTWADPKHHQGAALASCAAKRAIAQPAVPAFLAGPAGSSRADEGNQTETTHEDRRHPDGVRPSVRSQPGARAAAGAGRRAGAELAVLPEYFCLMGARDTDKLAVRETAGAGTVQDFLADAARELGLWIVGGTLPLEARR